MSSDVSAQAQANAVAREDLKLGCFPDGHHSDLSLSPSPDSTSSNLSRSDHESRISPDCDMQLIGRKGSSHLDNKLTPSLADNVFHNKHLNLNQTFISTPINGRDCWNANLCRPASADILNENVFGSLERAKTYSESAEQGSEDGSYASSHKAENDYCSMSSGGMILRTNSFCLADQSAPVVSSLDESCHLEDQMENSNHLSHDGPQQSNATVSGLGMTFIQEENCSPQTEKEDMNCDDCLVVLPSEDECLLQRTFFVSDTPSDKSFETPPAHGTLSPEEVKTLVYTMTAAKDAEDVHTSTPVQNIGNKTASLPDFLESPCMDQQKLPEPLPNDPCFEENKDKKETKKPNLSNLRSKVLKKPAQKTAMTTPAKLRPVQLSVKSKNIEISKGAVNRGKSSVSDPPRQVNAGSSGVTITSKCTHETQSFLALDASSRECIPVSSVAPQTATAQDLDSLAQGHGNQTFCLSVLEISSRQIEPQPKSKKSLLDRIKVRTGSTTSPDVPPVPKMRPRGSSDSSLFSKATKEKKTFRLSSTFSFPRNDKNQLKAKPGNKISSGNKAASPGNYLEKPGQSSSIVVKKNSLVAESSRAAAVEGESSGHGAKRAPLSQPTPATTKPIPLPTTLRLANCVKTESRSSKPTSAVQAKQTSGTGVQKTPISRASSVRTASTSTKPSLNRLRAPQGPASHSSACFTSTPGSKLPRPGPRQSQTLDSGHNKRVEGAVGSQVSTGGAAPKQTPFKAMKNVFLRAKLAPTPAKPNRATPLSTSVASAKKGLSNSTEGPQRRTSTSRLVRLTPSKHVDKKTTKASTRPQQATQNNGPPDVVPSDLVEDERKERLISQLKDDLAAKNLSFEAITVVLKQSLTERDEATRQRREQSQELVTLRGELVSSVHSAERLEKEKEDVQRSLEEALHDVQEQHRKDLDEVEKRVRAFYQVEWDKVHLTYQEEADKCKARMQEQLAELQAQHEAMKQELEMSHTHQLRCFKQQYEASLEELRKVHSQELESLDRTVKEAEAALSGQIQQLSEENKVLQQKLTAEEGRRKKLAESSQKDSRTVYLEQELESLKVVLDIKTKQLHQQEKKLMEIDKLTEKNVKLDESLKKVQQENEDLKARMERHAALSRQLSTDQAMLQQTLQKESKVNKRLSMENEELLWKLNNGELNSPHRVSPSSPSHSFNLQSPCRSNIFSSPSVSPR